MTNVMTLQESNESRFNRILKDEQGLTMVELLATVVILAIIMGVGAVAIGQVIQNSKEDAAVSEAQNAFTAAKLYISSSVGASATSFSTKTLVDAKNYEVGNTNIWGGSSTLDANLAKVTFAVSSDGVLSMTIGDGALTAGQKTSNGTALTGLNSTKVAELTRNVMFVAP